jgi:hypothetical protein
MNFFESIFGADPDGGNGSLETILIIGVAAVLLLIAFAAMQHYRTGATRT